MQYLIVILLIPFMIWGGKVFTFLWDLLCLPINLLLGASDMTRKKEGDGKRSAPRFTPIDICIFALLIPTIIYCAKYFDWNSRMFRETFSQLFGSLIFLGFVAIFWKAITNISFERAEKKQNEKAAVETYTENLLGKSIKILPGATVAGDRHSTAYGKPLDEYYINNVQCVYKVNCIDGEIEVQIRKPTSSNGTLYFDHGLWVPLKYVQIYVVNQTKAEQDKEIKYYSSYLRLAEICCRRGTLAGGPEGNAFCGKPILELSLKDRIAGGTYVEKVGYHNGQIEFLIGRGTLFPKINNQTKSHPFDLNTKNYIIQDDVWIPLKYVKAYRSKVSNYEWDFITPYSVINATCSEKMNTLTQFEKSCIVGGVDPNSPEIAWLIKLHQKVGFTHDEAIGRLADKLWSEDSLERIIYEFFFICERKGIFLADEDWVNYYSQLIGKKVKFNRCYKFPITLTEKLSHDYLLYTAEFKVLAVDCKNGQLMIQVELFNPDPICDKSFWVAMKYVYAPHFHVEFSWIPNLAPNNASDTPS